MSMYCIVFTPSYLPIALVVQVEMGQASLSVCPAIFTYRFSGTGRDGSGESVCLSS